MKLATGRIENGVVRLDDETTLPEETRVILLVDLRHLSWHEAGKLVGDDEVGEWSGLLDVWEASGHLEPLLENRNVADVVDRSDELLPPPTAEEGEEFIRALRIARGRGDSQRTFSAELNGTAGRRAP